MVESDANSPSLDVFKLYQLANISTTSGFLLVMYPPYPHTQATGRSGRIGRARASCAGDQEFGSWLSETNDFKIDTGHFLVAVNMAYTV